MPSAGSIFGRHGRDLAVADGHVADRVDLVPGVDDVAAAEQQVVRWLGVVRRASSRTSKRLAVGIMRSPAAG